MQTNQLGADAGTQAGTDLAGFRDLVKRLQPINRLPREIVTKLVEKSTIEHCASDEEITEIVKSSSYVHYLADGALTLVGQDGNTERLESEMPKALKAIERRSGVYKKIVAVGPCALVRVPWELLENFLMEFAPAELSTNSEVEVSEILTATASNWMFRLLQSELFSSLPAINIQEVLARIALIPTDLNEPIVKEGQTGDHFYVVESGQYIVTRKSATTGREINLATLGPGDSFGEEALITEAARCATVTTSQPGNLLKLDGDHFRRWMMEPVINQVSADEAKSLSDNGCQWIDVREPAAYAQGCIPGSLNIGINVLRLKVNQLVTDNNYIVCDSDPKIAALAAFLLGDRGFNVHCLDEPINEYCEKFAVELELNGQLDSPASPHVATENNEPVLNAQRNEGDRLPPTSADKPLPEGGNNGRTDPATMEKVTNLFEDQQQLPGNDPSHKMDLSETVFGIGLTDLIGDLAGAGDESGVDGSTRIAEAGTNDIPANVNATDESLVNDQSVQVAVSDEQTTRLDSSGKVVALESREKELRQATSDPLEDNLSTTNVLELSVAKDASDATNKDRSHTADQLDVFQQSSLTDAPQQPWVVDIEARLSNDAERLSSEMGAKVTETVSKYLDMQRSELEDEFEKRMKVVKDDAVRSMRAHELRVAASYQAKQQRIKANGQKLVVFANKLKRLKADLQRSKKLIEEQMAVKAD